MIIRSILTFLAVMVVSFSTFAQPATSAADLKDFKIIIENTDQGLSLQCAEGCAWTELAFSLKRYLPQAVDEYGMTESERDDPPKDPLLANFLFTIKKTDEGVTLKGIDGTAWIDLGFTLNPSQRQAIDQMGMTKLD